MADFGVGYVTEALQRFLYALFLAIDTNFRLKRKDVSSEARDPGLSRGWAFFGEVTAYMAHLDEHWDQKQEVRGERLRQVATDGDRSVALALLTMRWTSQTARRVGLRRRE